MPSASGAASAWRRLMPYWLSQAEFRAVTRSFWSRQMTAVVMPSRTASGRVRRRDEVSMCCGSQEAGHKLWLNATANATYKLQNGALLLSWRSLYFNADRRGTCELGARAVKKDGDQLKPASTNSEQNS